MSPTPYDRTASWLLTDGVSARDRRRAALVDALVGPARLGAVLDLCAGAAGTAAAVADLGHEVLAVDSSPARLAVARRHLRRRRGRLGLVLADVHRLRLGTTFDVVTCWAAFGAGPDEAHEPLLAAVRSWLRPAGYALLDVFDPAWWRTHAGEVTTRRPAAGPTSVQRLGFDAARGRLTVDRWLVGAPDDVVREDVRCYALEDVAALAAGAGLRVVATGPSIGAADPPSSLVVLAHADRS